MTRIKLGKKFVLLLIVSLISGCSNFFANSGKQGQSNSNNCPKIQESLLNQQAELIKLNQEISGQVSRNKPVLYAFQSQGGEKINYHTKDKVCVSIYTAKNQLLYSKKLPTNSSDKEREKLGSSGKYKLLISVPNGSKTFRIRMNLGTSKRSPFERGKNQDKLVYNFQQELNFKSSQRLDSIVNSLVKLAAAKGLPTQALSITLIDANTGELAEYQQEQLRYPASVVKLFWMVAFYAQQKAGILSPTAESETDMIEMIKKSDNEASSRILDEITNTKSGENAEDYQAWLRKREDINYFFHAAGYDDLNINQKTFPIPYLKEYGKSPQGYELKMRENPSQPTRNKISTEQAARLMYEIVTGQAVSPEYSRKMADLLTQDLQREAWVNIDPNFEFNPIRAFLGEGLPPNLRFLSKAGWTSQTRQEVAFVNDGNTAYILAIFAEDKAYATNVKIFPEMSRFVYERMKGIKVADGGVLPPTPTQPTQETQPQFQSSSQSSSLGWMRLGVVNNSSGTVYGGEPLISTNIPVFISPKTVPSVGDLVTVTTTTAVNLRSSAPQPPDYNLADKISSIEPGEQVLIRKVAAFKDSNTAPPHTVVWAEVGSQ